MNIGIIGSRNFLDYKFLCERLDGLNFEITKIISGGAPGADSLAERYAKEKGIVPDIHKAAWYDLNQTPVKIKLDKNGKEYNVLAGFNRNTKIVENSDLIIAFSVDFSSGTEDTIMKARKSKKPVLIYSI
jgi:hypothetical protein